MAFPLMKRELFPDVFDRIYTPVNNTSCMLQNFKSALYPITDAGFISRTLLTPTIIVRYALIKKRISLLIMLIRETS